MNKQSGFTLIELMVTVSILVILLGIGVPSFRSTIQKNRIRTVTNDIASALQLARSEAIKRGKQITLCSSSDQSSCSGTWAGGWVARNEAVSADAPLRVWPAPREGVGVSVPGSVVYNALGGVATARCFDVTLDSLVRSVTVSGAGRVQTSTTACP